MQRYRTDFAFKQADYDVIWSCASTFLGTILVGRVRNIISPHVFWMGVANVVAMNICNTVVFHLARHRRDYYTTVRTPLLVFTKAYRIAALKALATPHLLATRLLSSLTPGTITHTLAPLMQQCVQLGIYSFGYRLVSPHQALFLAVTAQLPLIRTDGMGLVSCRALAGDNPANWAAFAPVASQIKVWASRILPHIRWSPDDLERPCLAVCLTALLTLGFCMPLMLANIEEARCRAQFLARQGRSAPQPMFLWELAHAAAAVLIFGALLVALIDEASTISELITW